MLKIIPKYPSQRQIIEAREYEFSLISLEQFCDRWHLTYQQLAEITHTHVSVVKKWFSRTEHRKPGFEPLLRLTLADKFWSDSNH